MIENCFHRCYYSGIQKEQEESHHEIIHSQLFRFLLLHAT